MAIRTLSPEKLEAIRQNIFHPAHPAITDWNTFDWHRDQRGEPQADKLHSSQGLAIDVFGPIKAAHGSARDAILDALATLAGLPPGGPWRVELEWCDPDNLLCEPRRTQVDALATGANAIMVIECKFTEAGGSCSQTNRMTKGPGKGLRQCNGRYEPQTHPVSGVTAPCTLSGKGIRYWDVVPHVFALDPGIDQAPCPFSGETFQWMRNMALASELGRTSGKAARCVIAYAAGGGFPTEAKAQDLSWLPPTAAGAAPPFAVSYQRLAQLAAAVDDAPTWSQLFRWIDRKVAAVRAGSAAPLQSGGERQ